MKNEKKVPNPNGKKGSLEHREKIDEVVKEMENRNLLVVKEVFIRLFGKSKKCRFADAAGFDEDNNFAEIHQVGKTNKNGTPVKRERDALDDIEEAKGIRPKFHPFSVLMILLVILLCVLIIF